MTLDTEQSFRARLIRRVAAAGKRLLPDVVVQELRSYRAYSKAERPIYLKLRMSNAIGRENPKLPPSQNFHSILFVCYGNIMRSPMCEALMIRELANLPHSKLDVASAGLNATPGKRAHPWAVAAAADLGISLENHGARLLTHEMVDGADAIFAMDYQNQVQLLSRWPAARNKVFMLSAYASPEYRSAEIADPFYLGPEGTRSCYATLNVCIQNLVRSLSAQAREGPTAETKSTR